MEMLMEAGKMIVEGAGEAILGSACESFLKSIQKRCMYDYPVLVSVISRVENLKEMIPKMEDHNIKLGDRQDEVKELKEEMERGTRLLDELPDFNKLSWFMQTSYNEQLDELDASLESLVKKLRLQSALDVKEVLVSTKENSKVVKKNTKIVKCTKRKVYEVDETVKDIKKMQKVILNIMEKQNMANLKWQGDHALEGAALLRKLGELDDVLQDPTQQVPDAYTMIKGSITDWLVQEFKRITQRMHRIFELVERKTAENEELTYIPVSVLKGFRISIEDGVSLLRSCPTILEWTDELMSEYTNRFRALENTLEALYNRLAGIRPLKWRCGNCDKSPGTTSISIVDSTGFFH